MKIKLFVASLLISASGATFAEVDPSYATAIPTRTDPIWLDYVWKGSIKQCGRNPEGGTCTVTITDTYSFSVSYGLDIKASDSLSHKFSATFSYSNAIAFSQTLYPGQFIQPVMIQKRNYQCGYFKGYRTRTWSPRRGWVYGPGNPNQTFGSWCAHTRVGEPYQSYAIWRE